MNRIALITLVFLLAPAAALAQFAGKPPNEPQRLPPSRLEHRPEPLRLLGSTRPVPEAHVRCLVPMEEFWERHHVWAQTVPDPKLREALLAIGERSSRDLDWGVLPRFEYSAMLAEAGRQAAEARKRLDAALREYLPRRDMPARYAQRGRLGGLDGRDALVLLVDYADLFNWSMQLAQHQAFMAYARCAIANDLPPTVGQ